MAAVPLQGVEDALDALETALTGQDAGTILSASALLDASLAPLRDGGVTTDAPAAERLHSALARVEGLRTRIAVLAQFDRDRLTIVAEGTRHAPPPTYGPGGRLRLAIDNG